MHICIALHNYVLHLRCYCHLNGDEMKVCGEKTGLPDSNTCSLLHLVLLPTLQPASQLEREAGDLRKKNYFRREVSP